MHTLKQSKYISTKFSIYTFRKAIFLYKIIPSITNMCGFLFSITSIIVCFDQFPRFLVQMVFFANAKIILCCLK